MQSRRFVAGVFFGAVVAACGGATATDLFGTPAADATTSPTSTPTNTPTSTPTAPPTSPTTEPTLEPPPFLDGSIPPRDAGDASRPDATTRDAGPPGISCGSAGTCGLTDTCCALYVQGTFRFECRAGQVTCPEPSTQINCDSNEDCPNAGARVCCGNRVASSYYDNIKCSAACTGNDVVFCNPATPTVSCGARPCQESTLLRGYYVCN